MLPYTKLNDIKKKIYDMSNNVTLVVKNAINELNKTIELTENINKIVQSNHYLIVELSNLRFELNVYCNINVITQDIDYEKQNDDIYLVKIKNILNTIIATRHKIRKIEKLQNLKNIVININVEFADIIKNTNELITKINAELAVICDHINTSSYNDAYINHADKTYARLLKNSDFFSSITQVTSNKLKNISKYIEQLEINLH